MPKKYIIILIAVAVLFFGLVSLGIRSLTKNDKPNKPATSQTEKQKDFAKDTRSVVFTEQGKLVGEENRRAVRITITATERRIEILQGYDQTVIKSQTTPNKQNAYDTFLIALSDAGFGRYNKDISADERGTCPNGKRFIYEAQFKDDSKYRAWASSCKGGGSFEGNNGLVRTIFENQIPELRTFMSGVRLS